MNIRSISLIPSAALAVTVAFVRVSGDDKAPWLVLLALAVIAAVFVGALLAALILPKNRAGAFSLAAAAALPLLYTGAVIGLADAGWIDSESFLGFR